MNQTYSFGKWYQLSEAIKGSDVSLLLQRTQNLQNQIRGYPYKKIFYIISCMHKIWSDESGPFYKGALEILSTELGLCKDEMHWVLKAVPLLLDEEFLRQKITAEWGEEFAGDFLRYDAKNNRLISIRPLGNILHIISANMFFASLSAIIMGLLTKNISLINVSANESSLFNLFLQSLHTVDFDGVVSSSFATFCLASDDTESVDGLKARAAVIAVWEDDEKSSVAQCLDLATQESIGIQKFYYNRYRLSEMVKIISHRGTLMHNSERFENQEFGRDLTGQDSRPQNRQMELELNQYRFKNWHGGYVTRTGRLMS